MAAILQWTPQDWLPLTLKELTDAHDATLLATWDHTATLAALTYNLTVVVAGLASKSKTKTRTMTDFHPYRKTKRTGLIIDADNIGILQALGNAMMGGRK